MSYGTKQREILINFFKKNKDKFFTAQDISNFLSGEDISVSAIYRNIAELEKLGKIKKVMRVGEKSSSWQFVDHPSCKGHIHVSCKNCGKTMHLSEDDSKSISNKLQSSFNFCLDESSSMLYGICNKCLKKQEAIKWKK